jgi:serpin B
MIDNGPIQGIELLAINSIYLKASWLQQFSKGSTTQDLFYSSPSRITTTLSEAFFMHQVKEFQYSHTAIPGYQIINLPFIGDSLSMFVVLPQNEDLTSDSLVLSTDLIDALPQLKKTRIALALPKFKFMTTYDDNLKSSLQSIGLTAPFIGGLCIFKNDCSSFVSEIIQKTVIDVNEEGVEAAAVTMIVSRTSGFITTERPVEFLADHPFQFFIYDRNEELMIFEGRVGNPGIPEGSTEPSLKASHTHKDFWSKNFGVDVIVFDPLKDNSITYSNAQTNVDSNNNNT